MQIQLQVLLVVQGVSIEVAKPQVFDGASERVLGFVTACKLYIRMRIRRVVVNKQIQCILSYV